MIGQNIGKYRVLDRVGRGGMGTVFRALDDTLNREVAIKILNAELNDPEVARRFRAEAVTVARLNHPGIATIFELFQHDGQWLMVMEFVRGETLEHMVERLGPLSPQRAADLVMQGLAALSHAHRMGVVHRDLKPANLMITESGAVKIMDFGIARVAGSEHLTSAGFLMGTPAYMAPEQVTGGEIDARTDLYSMGVVFYYLVTARLPFKGDNPIAMAQSRVNDRPIPVAQVREGLPAWIEPLLDRALSKSPEDRFPSADQFREALRRGLAGLPMETLSGVSIPPELVATTPPGTFPLPGAIPPLVDAADRRRPRRARRRRERRRQTSSNPSARAAIDADRRGRRVEDAARAGASGQAQRPPLNPIAIALGALVVVLAVVLGVMWFRSHRAAAPAAPVDTAASTPTPTRRRRRRTPAEVDRARRDAVNDASARRLARRDANAAADDGQRHRVRASPPPAAGTHAAPRPPASPAASAGTTGRAAAPTPTPRPASPAIDAAPVVFNDVKYIRIQGDKGDDRGREVDLRRRADPGAAAQQGSGLHVRAVPAARARDVRAREESEMGSGAGRSAAHDRPVGLLVAEHAALARPAVEDDFVILRLDDSNWQTILDTFETRTGLKVDRPPSTDK